MRKKIKISTFVAGAAVVSVIIFYYLGGAAMSVGDKKFKVEIAEGDKEKALGLGNRRSLCRSCGMLFLFPEKGKRSFWMKNMRFPLDIIWIGENKIVHMEKNIPSDSVEIFSPSEEADMVLEINGGLADEYGFSTGEDVKTSGLLR